MEPEGTSITLIFYKVGSRWWREPLLNIVASFAQMSDLTHVEIAIGEHAGQAGEMKNVCRVFSALRSLGAATSVLKPHRASPQTTRSEWSSWSARGATLR